MRTPLFDLLIMHVRPSFCRFLEYTEKNPKTYKEHAIILSYSARMQAREAYVQPVEIIGGPISSQVLQISAPSPATCRPPPAARRHPSLPASTRCRPSPTTIRLHAPPAGREPIHEPDG